jgi:hypothetical protein
MPGALLKIRYPANFFPRKWEYYLKAYTTIILIIAERKIHFDKDIFGTA